eukprot:6209676-Pleurochrysis_carterae.AAC.1
MQKLLLASVFSTKVATISSTLSGNHQHKQGWARRTPKVAPTSQSLQRARALTKSILLPQLDLTSDSGFFIVDAGLCTVTADGDCVQSPNYPQPYGESEACDIALASPIVLNVLSFDVELFPSCIYDFVQVNGQKYCGTEGPDGVTAEGQILWRSDTAFSGAGWKI